MKMRRQDHVRLWTDKSNLRLYWGGRSLPIYYFGSRALDNDMTAFSSGIQNIGEDNIYITYSYIYVS